MMTDFKINDYILQQECEFIAKEIFDNAMESAESDKTPEHHRDDMQDGAHQYCDGHKWVIYYYKAHMLCAHCDTGNGEQFLEDTGMPDTPTYDSLGTLIAYGEMVSRVQAHIETLIEEWEG